jgi:hypothetical protein
VKYHSLDGEARAVPFSESNALLQDVGNEGHTDAEGVDLPVVMGRPSVEPQTLCRLIGISGLARTAPTQHPCWRMFSNACGSAAQVHAYEPFTKTALR